MKIRFAVLYISIMYAVFVWIFIIHKYLKIQGGYTYFADGTFNLFYTTSVFINVSLLLTTINLTKLKSLFYSVLLVNLLMIVTFSHLDYSEKFIRYSYYVTNQT